MNPESDSVLDTGGYPNEDRLTVLDQAAWVIDGTSGFGERELLDHPEGDGSWFVETVEAYLRDHVYDDISLEEIVAGAIDHVATALVEEVDVEPSVSLDPPHVDDAVSMSEIPASTIALVRWDEDELEYYTLGDSSVLLRTGTGVEHHIEGRIQEFDDYLKGIVTNLVASDDSLEWSERFEELRPYIQETRQYREVPGGFWCLGINPVSAKQGVDGAIPLEDVKDVYLYSDGFLDVIDEFELFEDWEAMADYIDAEGVKSALSRLRTVQDDDAQLVEHPRLKPKDDVALVHLDFAARRDE